MRQSLSWVKALLGASQNARSKARKLTLEALRKFKKGKESEEGDDLARTLDKDWQFIGFSPNIIYIKEKSSYRDELDCMWVHAFSTYTLLYKHKKLPLLVLANPNIDLNDSRLSKIDGNIDLEELKDIIGITG